MMSAQNVSLLAQRLRELLVKLDTFDQRFEDNFQILDARWAQLDQVWDGSAYASFSGGWEDVRAMMKKYIELSRGYEEYLRDRVKALEDFES